MRKHPANSSVHFGASSLSRLECLTCKETTLHKHNKCIHCGAEHTGMTVRSIDTWRSQGGGSR